jgi:hypothetical protein
MLAEGRQTRGVRKVARYKMTVMFDVHEKVDMKYVYHGGTQGGIQDKITCAYEALNVGIEDVAVMGKTKPHINKLYEDVIERIERSLKHPITYDILSFEKIKEE